MPPGPRGWNTFGFVRNGSGGGPLGFLTRTARQYGPISSFRILGQQIFLIDDADLIQEVLVKQQHSYVRDTGATLLRELVGDGLLTRDEPLHRERRRILQPAFHRAQIASYADSMVDESERLVQKWQSGQAVDIDREMRHLTLAIVGSALFGADFRSSAERIADVLQRVINRARWIAPGIALLEPAARAYRRRWPHGRSLFFPAERQELEQLIAPVIAERRAAQGHDVLSLLLAQRDEEVTLGDEDIQNEIVTLVLAGHETTATALTWTWHLLAGHPDVAVRMEQEVEAVLGERRLTLEDLPKLTYTTMVFNEAMRLYPPAALFGRRPVDDVLLGGYTVPRGASILMSPYITQRNPRYFPEPDAFRPERWESMVAPKFAYFPFGGGAKMCIGEPFARMEGIIALATVARRWRMRPADESRMVDMSIGVTLRPARPIHLIPTLR